MPDAAIAWYQILIAAVLAGGVVWFVARRSDWSQDAALGAAVGAAVLIGLWRWAANVLQLNGDFIPLVSVGDAACLVVGAIAPAAVGVIVRGVTINRWPPIVVGGVAAFVINVVVL
ncbi:MAG: hypothetical protein KGJ86_12255 [Chloroflexota bacterium]|nr:hypothetical protein [Chloroflexota bacterium]